VARIDPAHSTLVLFVLFSVCAHLLFTLGMIFFPSLRPARRNLTINTLPVSLVAAPPRESQAPAAAPAAAKPQPEPEGVTALNEPPPPPTPAKKEPERKAAEPEPAKPKPPAAATEQSGDDALPEGAAAHSLDGDAGAVTGLVGMGTEFDWYRDAVNRALYTSWRQPILQFVFEPLEVAVYFEILRDGSTRNLRIDQESGTPALDRSALRAVQEAMLPPLPRNFREPTQEALVVFRYFPDQ